MILNMDKIHPLKRDKLLAGLQWLEEQGVTYVDKIVVFGSSVRDDCTDESDIDLCVFSDMPTERPEMYRIFGKFQLVIDEPCDLLMSTHISEKFQNEINKNGVVVYVGV